jgi:hypothetical protein
VAFKDGTMRAVYPSREDPMMFEEQLVSSDDEGLVRVTPGQEETIFPPTCRRKAATTISRSRSA